MKNKITGILILLVIALAVSAAVIFNYTKEEDDRKKCANQLIEWWLIAEDYKKKPGVTPGKDEPELAVRLTVHALKMKKIVPPARCPIHHCEYVFSGTIPETKTLPATCPKHPNVIRWEENPPSK
jgi:hypothetical protein